MHSPADSGSQLTPVAAGRQWHRPLAGRGGGTSICSCLTVALLASSSADQADRQYATGRMAPSVSYHLFEPTAAPLSLGVSTPGRYQPKHAHQHTTTRPRAALARSGLDARLVWYGPRLRPTKPDPIPNRTPLRRAGHDAQGDGCGEGSKEDVRLSSSAWLRWSSAISSCTATAVAATSSHSAPRGEGH